MSQLPLTKRVLESAPEGGITDHVGYEKHDATGRGSGHRRNGTRSRTVLTGIGRSRSRCPATPPAHSNSITGRGTSSMATQVTDVKPLAA
ncbi:transposase [Streptomyces sp. SBT349]|uniref:transposase n=1 Tax=Streptomyces sp. SBT349 TaxID=1580539 RepID=UPI000B1FB4AA